jgi:hypothetical protein
MKRNYIFMFILLVISQNAISQKIIRQSISCLGSSHSSNNTFVQQTIGQSSNITNFHNGNSNLRQGFLQPFKNADPTNFSLHNNIYLTVYPNPFQNYFIIRTSGNDNYYIVNVTDILGKIVLTSEITENNEQLINSSEWNRGVYLINIYCEGKMEAVKKIIKKN